MRIARCSAHLCVILLVLAGAGLAAQSPIDTLVGRFYERHGSRLVWSDSGGITPQASKLVALLAGADSEGLDPASYRVNTSRVGWSLDSALTRAFFAYAADLAQGRVKAALVDTQWTAAAPRRDLVTVLADAIDSGDVGDALRRLAPSDRGYLELRHTLGRYRAIAQAGGWPVPLGRRLAAEGYDTTGGLTAALRRFQSLHGLAADGIVGPATRTQLNVSAAERGRQIALNLERWRWLPRPLGDRYILVNSAAFSLDLVDSGAVVFTARVIVGRPDWPTPITSSQATDLVFRPVWKVPRAIAAQELLPLLQRDSAYAPRHGIRVSCDSSGEELDPTATDWHAVTESTFAYQLLQEPGRSNPLGGVKLVFWTPFTVFLHDTPFRSLFNERGRAFSHGCVRVERADALAVRLLPTWSVDSIASAMASGRERWVRLPRPIAVHLVYWTAWATADGLVGFASDVYGWDDKLAAALQSQETLQ